MLDSFSYTMGAHRASMDGSPHSSLVAAALPFTPGGSGSSPDPSREPCKFFLNGGCVRGENCMYSHEMPDERHLDVHGVGFVFKSGAQNTSAALQQQLQKQLHGTLHTPNTPSAGAPSFPPSQNSNPASANGLHTHAPSFVPASQSGAQGGGSQGGGSQGGAQSAFRPAGAASSGKVSPPFGGPTGQPGPSSALITPQQQQAMMQSGQGTLGLTAPRPPQPPSPSSHTAAPVGLFQPQPQRPAMPPLTPQQTRTAAVPAQRSTPPALSPARGPPEAQPVVGVVAGTPAAAPVALARPLRPAFAPPVRPLHDLPPALGVALETGDLGLTVNPLLRLLTGQGMA